MRRDVNRRRASTGTKIDLGHVRLICTLAPRTIIPCTHRVPYAYAGRLRAELSMVNGDPALRAPSREFIYSDSVPGSGLVATIAGGSSPTTTYFHDDQLSWRVSTDGTSGSPTYGQVIGQQGSYPFGQSWYSSNGNEFAFTTYQRDSESGLDYAMVRYYDSSAARFCSADPVGGQVDDPQTWNRYTYARNDPIDLTDPSGQGFLSWLIDALLIGADILTSGFFAPETAAILGTTDVTINTANLAITGALGAAGAATAYEQSKSGGQRQSAPQQQQTQTPQGNTKSPCLTPGVQAALQQALIGAANKALGTQLGGTRTTDTVTGQPNAPGGGVTVDMNVPPGGVPIDPDVANNAGSPFPGFHKGYSSDIRTDTPLPGTSSSSHVVFNTTTMQNGQVLLTGAQVHGDIGNPRRDLGGLFKHVWKDVIRAPRISAKNGGCPVKFIGD